MKQVLLTELILVSEKAVVNEEKPPIPEKTGQKK